MPVPILGILSENRSVWDRRVPLTPLDIKVLKQKNPSLEIIVQPSKIRIFKNSEYEAVGAKISEDLSKCNLIIGVREVPLEKIISNTTYMFFGHLIKAQAKNMNLLDTLLERKVRFIDYEKIVDDNNKRLVYFGKIAGIAACIDFLAGLGALLLKKGISTPLLTISYSYKYFSLEEAKLNIEKVSGMLKYSGLPEGLCPMVFAITGKGKTSSGVFEILKLMPIKVVDPDDLPKIYENPKEPIHRQNIYVCFIEQKHMVTNMEKPEFFDKIDYYSHPTKYKPSFHSKYLPYISVIFNCMYWDHRFPRLIDDEQMINLCVQNKNRLIGVCDISCDLEGSIEFLKKYTNEDNHFYTYDAVNKKVIDDVHNIENGILYQAIDAISTELSFDASSDFGVNLLPFIERILLSDINLPLEEQGLQYEIKRAVITWNGSLTKDYRYIDQLRKANEGLKNYSNIKHDKNMVELDLHGHLFDSLAINDILTIIKDDQNLKIDFNPYFIGRNNEEKSRTFLIISCEDAKKRKETLEKIEKVCLQKNIDMIRN